MPAEPLPPSKNTGLPAPVLPPHATTAVLHAEDGSPEAAATPEARQAYLFRFCPAHPLRHILADHRGVQE